MRAWFGSLIIAVATVEAGWMAFDRLRALVVGDYFTPASGNLAPGAGEGNWIEQNGGA